MSMPILGTEDAVVVFTNIEHLFMTFKICVGDARGYHACVLRKKIKLFDSFHNLFWDCCIEITRMNVFVCRHLTEVKRTVHCRFRVYFPLVTSSSIALFSRLVLQNKVAKIINTQPISV